MVQATCIRKLRDRRNQVYGYRLRDSTGAVRDISYDAIRNAIRDEKIHITNLELTSDNRLVDVYNSISPKPIKPTQQKSDDTILLNKIKLLGAGKRIETACGNPCYLISRNDTEHIIYIPDNVTQLNNVCDSVFYDTVSKLEGNIKVMGGNGLIDACKMFMMSRAQSIDLSSFNTSNITSMYAMFSSCKAESLDLSSFDTSNVIDMIEMFRDCRAQSLDLSSFDTSNVIDMHAMFFTCAAKSINLSSFNTSKVTDMNSMFCHCKAQSLDLTSFDTSNVTTMHNMFEDCGAQSIDLSSFDTINVVDMNKMFKSCPAQALDLSSFDTRRVADMSWMFSNCKVKSLDLSLFDTRKVEDMFAMFCGCNLELLDISSFNVDKANISEIFTKCNVKSLKTDNERLLEQYNGRHIRVM